MKLSHHICTALLIAALFLNPLRANTLEQSRFTTPDNSSAVHTWWHWISGNITKEGISKDLESMSAQGISQATILNVGGHVTVRLEELENIKFNTPEWYEMFRFALDEASRLGIKIGVHNCDGWATSAGPWVTLEESMKQYTWSKTIITGGKRTSIQLPQPPTVLNYYEDVSVIAYPTTESSNSHVLANPTVTFKGNEIGTALHDGNPFSDIVMKPGDRIDFTFSEPKEFNQLSIVPFLKWSWTDVRTIVTDVNVYTSIDGVKYTPIGTYSFKGVNQAVSAVLPPTSSRFIRLEIENTDSEFPVGIGGAGFPIGIAEAEILNNNDSPSYNPGLANHLQKIVSVRVSDPAAFDSATQTTHPIISENAPIDISEFMNANGTLEWEAPAGNWSIMRFGFTTTGHENAPPTPEGKGLEIDKFDKTAAKKHFDAFTGKLIDHAGLHTGDTFKFMLIDSWECRFQNWTATFPEAFESKRGYSLKKWIPVLCGELVGSIEDSEAFMQDFRKTIAELIDENYYQTMANLCHENNLEFHSEVIYDSVKYPPLDILKINGYVDLPMFEFWATVDQSQRIKYKPRKNPIFQFASQSASIYGQNVIGAEAYTSFAAYSESPSLLKRNGDSAYTSGINQFILHTFVHQPWEKKPGFTLGIFGSPFQRNNPWWNKTDSWITYHNRIQFLLQNSEPAFQVASYIGDNYPQRLDKTTYSSVPQSIGANLCNHHALKTRASILENGQLSFGGNQQYALLTLLPTEANCLSYDSLQTIANLVEQGLVLYGPPPTKPVGLGDNRKNAKKFATLVEQLWGTNIQAKSIDKRHGKGRVLWGSTLDETLQVLNITPDIITNQDLTTLAFTHKRTNEAELYFIANQQNKNIATEILVKAKNLVPEIWHPENGMITNIPIYTIEGEQLRIPLNFAPSESYFVVLRPSQSKNNVHITNISQGEKQLFPNKQHDSNFQRLPQIEMHDGNARILSGRADEYTFKYSDGNTATCTTPTVKAIDLAANGFDLSFKSLSKNSPTPLCLERLQDLSEFEDPEIKYFGGNLIYTFKFDLSNVSHASKENAHLHLGNFNAIATVSLNNEPLGNYWNPNTSIPLPELNSTENTLQIVVTTTLRNRAIGDFIEHEKLTNIWSPKFVKSNLNTESPLMKVTGLSGPVTVTVNTTD